MPDPSVSPADTIRHALDLSELASQGDAPGSADEARAALDVLLAVGERDKAEIEKARYAAAVYEAELREAAVLACTFGPREESLCPMADPDGQTTWCAPCFARAVLADKEKTDG